MSTGVDVRARHAPIALFVYNRPAHTRRTLEALRANEGAAHSDLFVFCDGAKHETSRDGVAEVRALARNVEGFRSVSVVEQSVNLGLANSIIRGVTQVCSQHDSVIVVEDDLVTAPYFLRFMNEALALYRDDETVGSIHGYWYAVDCLMPDTFFLRGASCWGWATWSRAWRQFEPDGAKLLRGLSTQRLTDRFDLDGAMAYTRMLADQIAGRNDSWAIRWHASMFLAGRLQLSPGRSLVQNIGFDSTGTHRVQSNAYDTQLAGAPVRLERLALAESAAARAALIRYYRSTRRSLPARIVGRLRRMMAR